MLGHKLISVYIEHEHTKLDTYKPSPIKKCTIVELEYDATVATKLVA